MTTQTPLKTEMIKGLLGSGDDVTIEGTVFERPIFPTGDPLVHTQVLIYKGELTIGAAYFADPMEDEELKDKLKEISENITPYLYPAYK